MADVSIVFTGLEMLPLQMIVDIRTVEHVDHADINTVGHDI